MSGAKALHTQEAFLPSENPGVTCREEIPV